MGPIFDGSGTALEEAAAPAVRLIVQSQAASPFGLA
jgi:hypothetical protein